MGSSWSGFDPQNELVKLQWALLEASEFQLTEREFAVLLAISGLSPDAKSQEDSESDAAEPAAGT